MIVDFHLIIRFTKLSGVLFCFFCFLRTRQLSTNQCFHNNNKQKKKKKKKEEEKKKKKKKKKKRRRRRRRRRKKKKKKKKEKEEEKKEEEEKKKNTLCKKCVTLDSNLNWPRTGIIQIHSLKKNLKKSSISLIFSHCLVFLNLRSPTSKRVTAFKHL